jgi:FAD/FMN-containing dehydrogenase
MPTPALEPSLIATLRSTLAGRLVLPGDPAYDQARALFYSGEERYPAAIAYAQTADEVAAVVNLARDHHLPLAVRSGGHSNGRQSVLTDSLVLDLSEMNALEIDVEQRIARAEPGVTAAQSTAAAAAHDLVTGFGDTGTVALGGLVVGGGVGYLVRQYGLTIDSLLAAEVVTANGDRLHVDAATHPDLFWAIRGGGGNFGIVTRYTLRLHPLGPVYGGMLILPATPDAIAGFLAAADQAPDTLSAIANIMPAPPLPFLAAAQHGQLVNMALMVYLGDSESAQAVFAPFRALAPPLADTLHAIQLPEMYQEEDASYHPMGAGRTLFLDSLGGETAQLIVDTLNASDAAFRVTQLRVLGGAMARVPHDATAYAHRDRRIMANIAALYTDLADKPKYEAWVDQYHAALQPHDRAAYVNFVSDEGPDRAREAYPGTTCDRLRAIKALYDPTNLFQSKQNIPPAAPGAG